jgi:hypothetical protein
LTRELAGDRNIAHRAVWEAKSTKLVEKNLVRNKMTDMKKRETNNLEVRKQRLAALLQAEESQLELEFQANLETPEQVRAKMMERLTELEGKREVERRVEVNSRMEKRFK